MISVPSAVPRSKRRLIGCLDRSRRRVSPTAPVDEDWILVRRLFMSSRGIPPQENRQAARDFSRAAAIDGRLNRTMPMNISKLTPITFLERAAVVFADKTAVIYEDRQWTYAQLRERVHRLAGALRKAGIKPGDRVAFLSPNVPPLLDAHFGVP